MGLSRAVTGGVGHGSESRDSARRRNLVLLWPHLSSASFCFPVAVQMSYHCADGKSNSTANDALSSI